MEVPLGRTAEMERFPDLGRSIAADAGTDDHLRHFPGGEPRMRKLGRNHRMAAWGVSATVASLIAVAGAPSVLAEDPACVVDGQPVSTSELAADPTRCPAPPAEPAAAPAPAPAPA